MIGRVRIRLIDHWINPLTKHTAFPLFLGRQTRKNDLTRLRAIIKITAVPRASSDLSTWYAVDQLVERLLSPPPYFELSSRQEWWKTEEWLTVLNKTPCKFPLWTSDQYLYGHKGLFISRSPWMIYTLLSIFITHPLGLEEECTLTGSFSKETIWHRARAKMLGGGGNISSGCNCLSR